MYKTLILALILMSGSVEASNRQKTVDKRTPNQRLIDDAAQQFERKLFALAPDPRIFECRDETQPVGGPPRGGIPFVVASQPPKPDATGSMVFSKKPVAPFARASSALSASLVGPFDMHGKQIPSPPLADDNEQY